MSWEPTRRAGGAWPGDRPVRWAGVARGMGWLLVGTSAALAQLASVVPLLVVAGGPAGEAMGQVGRVLLGLAWGALTLWAAWSWIFGRWRLLAAPVLTAGLLLVVSGLRRGVAGGRRVECVLVSEAAGWSRVVRATGGVRKVRAPQRRVAGNARPS